MHVATKLHQKRKKSIIDQPSSHPAKVLKTPNGISNPPSSRPAKVLKTQNQISDPSSSRPAKVLEKSNGISDQASAPHPKVLKTPNGISEQSSSRPDKVLKMLTGINGQSLPRPAKVLKIPIGTAAKKGKNRETTVGKIKSSKTRKPKSCPKSDGCARSSISGWEWHKWSIKASPAEKARVRGSHFSHIRNFGSEFYTYQSANAKGLSARTNRIKLRNLLAAAEGADLLKVTQLKVSIVFICWLVVFIMCIRC